MNARVKKMWIDALRSGEYTQGKRQLIIVSPNADTNFCCLGVLCDLHHKAGQTGRWNGEDYITPDAEDGTDFYTGSMPPPSVRKWLGIKVPRGSWDLPFEDRDGDFPSLAELNDDWNFTFSQIADLIEHVM